MMLLTAISLDPFQLLFWGVILLIGAVIGMLSLTIYANAAVPGFVTWIMSAIQGGLPVVLNSYMDGFMTYRVMKKESGSMVFNPGTDNEFLDRSVMDKKPMSTLHGHRVMIRVTASSLPNSMDEFGDIQRILDHIDENKDKYPTLSKLQEYEVFGALGHDPQTARELLEQNCQVATKELKDGKVVERPADEVNADIADKVDAILKEVELLGKNVEYLPRHSVFVDLARCVDATQLRIASQILKRYRAEIEALYRAKYGGVENSLWKGLLIGGAVGLGIGSIGVKLLGG